MFLIFIIITTFTHLNDKNCDLILRLYKQSVPTVLTEFTGLPFWMAHINFFN